MSNFVRFFDATDFQSAEVTEEQRDFYANTQAGQQVQPLRVRIAATHSGLITRNNGFYLPHKMRDGANSFVAQYDKPVQIHHDKHQDPVGRIVHARYVDISPGIKDAWSNKRARVQDWQTPVSFSLMDAFNNGELSDSEIYDVACKYFIEDAAVSADPDYQGLGYVEIIAEITDPDAIQKVLDRRYLTGSVGATTNKAMCSVCKQDWASKGKCDHRPGKVYDDVKCVLVAGDLSYDEYSFVNCPADRHSRVIEVNVNGIQDFVNLDDENIINLRDANTGNVNLNNNSEEENSMLFKDAFTRVSQHEFFKGHADGLEDAVKAVLDNKDLAEDALDSGLERLVADHMSLSDDFDKAFPAEQTEDATDDQDPVKAFWGDRYDEIVGEDKDTWGVAYAQMMMDAIEDAADDDAKKEATDAVLTAAARAKLADSVFCAPDRHLPVVDKVHYKAVVKHLDKFDHAFDETKVAEIVARKGKRLGCLEDKKSEPAAPVFETSLFDSYSDEELPLVHKAICDTFAERDISIEVADAKKVVELEAALAEAKAVVPDQALADEVKTLKDRLSAARKEIRYLHTDIENLYNSLADATSATRDAVVAHVADLKVLSGEGVDIQAISDGMNDTDTAQVQEILKDLAGKVDLHKIVDTINSGLTNVPEGTVENPTLVQDNTKQEDGDKRQLSDSEKRQLKLSWLQIRTQRGNAAADAWLDQVCENYNVDVSDINKSDKEQS